MSILLLGANHQSAPVALREKLAFSEAAAESAVTELVDGNLITEGLILSTCNRVEILAIADSETVGRSALLKFLSGAVGIPVNDLENHVYFHEGDQAVQHLFRVASSLDSMVVGEPQILGQVRKAYALAIKVGTAGRTLNRLLPAAFHVAKRVRTDTNIANSAVSVSYMAVELGRKIFDSLVGRTVLVIGAGETAELCARHLRKAGAGRLLFTNRTYAKAETLAATFSGEAMRFAGLDEHLAIADIVICSTGSPDYVITRPLLGELPVRRETPVVLIDISMPRNIDPALGKIPNFFVFNIDDLKALVASNLGERKREAERAETIVEAEVGRFADNLRAMEFGATVVALRDRMQEIARAELSRSNKLLEELTLEQQHAVESLLLDTVNRISHPLIGQLKQLRLQDAHK